MGYLLFTLYAPMASFGEIAVGERRMSWSRPARSAIMGLVAAALGIDRTDQETHQNLEKGLFYAVRTDMPGHPFMDFHTAQVPKSRRGQTFATRRGELGADNLQTVLSRREWRVDSFFTVVLWARCPSSVDIEDIAGALRYPSYNLYVGRKAAPLGLPFNPSVVEAESFLDALSTRSPNAVERTVLEMIGVNEAKFTTVAFDHDVGDLPPNSRIERRRDAIVNRERWQFSERLEGVVSIESHSDINQR